MQISGQLVEALVKFRLIADGYDVRGVQTLGSLLQTARRLGVFDASDATPLFDSTMSAALILRNWASHFQIYGRNPDATEAAQALVLLIAASNALFPAELPATISAWPDLPEGRARSMLESRGPGVGVGLLSRLPQEELLDILSEQSRPIALHLARFAAPSTILKFEAILRAGNLPTGDFKAAISSHFSSVIRNASTSSFRKVYQLGLVIRRLELNDHASILGILLPADPEFLTNLLRTRPPASVATYWAECFKANRGAIAKRFGEKKARSQFIETFWDVFRIDQRSIISFANILRTLPHFVRAELIKRAPLTDLLKWIKASAPTSSVNLLSSFGKNISTDKDLIRIRDRIVEVIAQSIATASPATLAKIPLRLHRIKAVDSPRSHPILRAIIDRIDGLGDWKAVRRIAWDSYCFFPDMADTVCEAVTGVISRRVGAIPVWERMCLLGLLTVAGRPSPEGILIASEEHLTVPPTLPGETDRWQAFLFVVGAARVGDPGLTPAGLLDSVARLLAETTAEQDTPSSMLLLVARAAVADQRRRAALSHPE